MAEILQLRGNIRLIVIRADTTLFIGEGTILWV